MDDYKKDEEVILPGFRFHPTDEELVGFYLRRKVERKPLRIELIKQVDIYKFDPWNLPLPKVDCVGDKECYFFCMRGRKYRNSVRPNRVTGSGFWKATGIDKPIYSSTGETMRCIGLKKSLVYYEGSAGKGKKTDWMMHEFRLPPSSNIVQEAEDWTLCRIFKRNASSKRYKPDLKLRESFGDASSESCSLQSENSHQYAKFENLIFQQNTNVAEGMNVNHINHLYAPHEQILLVADSSYSSSSSNFWNLSGDEFFREGRWDELSSVVDSRSDPTIPYEHYR
ncbi:hypothetical protein ACH5RR_036966 [Cinchona calisaya]|uniref:NAC domain-containing protein n=1 Tax=Cinchona calisaya TaxID=153742 RepID=A0ABD2Y9G5_9GENT